MTVFYQPFNGTNGADVSWATTEPMGSPVSAYTPSGSANFTTSNPIRGSASATLVKAAGQNTSQVSYGLGAGVTALRAHVYLRVPSGAGSDGFQVLDIVGASRGMHVVLKGNGAIRLAEWGTDIVTPAPDGTLPAVDTPIRVSLGVVAGGNVTVAVYREHGTEPLWTATASAGATGELTEVRAGIPWAWDAATALTVTIDDFRVETGVASPLLPPEQVPTASNTWVREPVGWRRLGTPEAVEERWSPPADIGARPPTAAPPAGAIHVSPTGSDTAAGTAAAPYATIGKALTAVAAGGTIVLRGGNHHYGMTVPTNGTYDVATMWAGNTADKANLTIMGYPGESAWIDGSTVLTGWTAASGRWEKNLTIAHDRSPTGSFGADDNAQENWTYVNPARPLAAWPERVWVDGVQQTQVSTLAAVAPGTFYVAGVASGTGGKVWTSTKYVLGTDPTGKEVRVADLATCMSTTGTGFVMRGVGIRRFASSVSQRGPFKVRHADALIEDVTFEDVSALAITLYEAHRTVLRRCSFRRAGLLAIEGTESDDITIDSCAVTDANSQGFNMAPESGGIKLTHARRPKIFGTAVYDSACNGIWLDESITNAVIANCDVHWCDGVGIMSELSHATTIAGCVVTRTGGECICIHNTSGAVRIWNNTASRPGRSTAYGRGITIIGDERAPLGAGSVGLDPRFGFPHPDGCTALTTDVTMRNNIIGPTYEEGSYWYCEDYSANKRPASAFGVKSSNNQFPERSAGTLLPWILGNSGIAAPTIVWSLASLKSAGYDAGSAMLVGDYGSDVAGVRTPAALVAAPAGAAIPADIAGWIGVIAGATNVIGAPRS